MGMELTKAGLPAPAVTGKSLNPSRVALRIWRIGILITVFP